MAPGSSACVEGRNAPIGLAGLAPIIGAPKYASSCPLAHGDALKSVAVPLSVPVSAKLSFEGLKSSLFGTSTSMNRSPEVGPGDVVKPNCEGGFVLVGEFVPLSTH